MVSLFVGCGGGGGGGGAGRGGGGGGGGGGQLSPPSPDPHAFHRARFHDAKSFMRGRRTDVRRRSRRGGVARILCVVLVPR